MSVPYAMYAQRADTALKVPDTSPTNEIQVLSISNDTIYLSDGGFAKLPPDEPQNLSVSPYGDTLYISDGNYAIVPGITLANQLVWNKTYGGSGLLDWGRCVQQTRDGGYIIAGNTNSSDGDNTDGNNGGNDIWILKLNPDGTKEWDKTYGGSSSEFAYYIQQTIEGGYILASTTTSSDGDITDGKNGHEDIWILKLNPDGTKEWDKTYGGSIGQSANYIQQTRDGGYIIAGTTYSSDGDVTDGNNGEYDIWILKLNPDGTKEWDRTYGGSSSDWAHFLQQTSDDAYIVAGRTNSSDGDISDGNNGEYDFWILKLNSDGTKKWDKTYGGSSSDWARCIQQTSDGGYVVTGLIQSSDGDNTDGKNGYMDFWILKLNPDGTKEWDKTYGSSGSEDASVIIQTSDGGYIVAGDTNSSGGDITNANNGGYDMWILKLNPDGTKQWDKTYGGSSGDGAYSIQQTSDGGYIIAGSTNSSDGDITDGNNGGSDFWILKLNANGEIE
jgi:hypothetical protein